MPGEHQPWAFFWPLDVCDDIAQHVSVDMVSNILERFADNSLRWLLKTRGAGCLNQFSKQGELLFVYGGDCFFQCVVLISYSGRSGQVLRNWPDSLQTETH